MTDKNMKQESPTISPSVLAWLLESDPSIRWQVMQDLLDTPAETLASERARVASEGMGASLLALQMQDGTWSGVAWNRGWNSTMHVLMLLKEMGLDPDSEQAQHAIRLVREHVTWQGWETYDGNPFFEGEVEPCINGQLGAVGAYFGQDVTIVINRLLTEQLADGGWNCEAQNGSTRSSFNTTICVLEALLEYDLRFGNRPDVSDARLKGEAYLLDRQLFKRKSTGELIRYDRKTGSGTGSNDPAFTRCAFPTWWHYDVLRGLDYFRRANATPDERMSDAIDLLASKADASGCWSLEIVYAGEMPIDMGDLEGQASRWNTLRALRVLKWYARGN